MGSRLTRRSALTIAAAAAVPAPAVAITAAETDPAVAAWDALRRAYSRWRRAQAIATTTYERARERAGTLRTGDACPIMRAAAHEAWEKASVETGYDVAADRRDDAATALTEAASQLAAARATTMRGLAAKAAAVRLLYSQELESDDHFDIEILALLDSIATAAPRTLAAG